MTYCTHCDSLICMCEQLAAAEIARQPQLEHFMPIATFLRKEADAASDAVNYELEESLNSIADAIEYHAYFC